MDRDLHVIIPEHVMIREVGGECVILDLNTEKYFGLDDVGTDIMRAFRSGESVGVTAAQIVKDYDASEAQVLADIEQLVEVLVERGLAQIVDKR